MTSVSIGHDLAKKIPITITPATDIIDVRTQCSFRFVSEREVKSVITGYKIINLHVSTTLV